MSLDVTRLRPEDETRWRELWGQYLDFYETVLPVATYDATWRRLLSGDELHGFAARDGDTIVGITHCLFHPTCWSERPLCYLQDLFVDARVRRQGAARALIEAATDLARSRDALRLYWMTSADNATARALYDRVAKHGGFIRYDIALS